MIPCAKSKRVAKIVYGWVCGHASEASGVGVAVEEWEDRLGEGGDHLAVVAAVGRLRADGGPRAMKTRLSATPAYRQGEQTAVSPECSLRWSVWVGGEGGHQRQME